MVVAFVKAGVKWVTTFGAEVGQLCFVGMWYNALVPTLLSSWF